MNLQGLPTPSMDWCATDTPRAFKQFREMCELMLDGPLDDLSEERKVKYVLLWAGEEGRELAATWNLSAADAKKLTSYWEKYEAYVKPKSNFRIARYKLRACKQEPNETVDSFVKRIRVIAAECKLQNVEENIIDTLIFGTTSEKIQAKLLQKDDNLTLDQALDIARTEEATRKQLQDLNSKEVHAIKARLNKPQQQRRYRAPTSTQQRQTEKTCSKCGTNHNSSDVCPAKGTTCVQCGKPNHWKRVCRSQGVRPKFPQQKKVHELQNDVVPELYFNTLTINAIDQHKDTQALIQLPVRSAWNERKLTCKIDTGAEGNIIPLTEYKRLGPDMENGGNKVPLDLMPSDTRITAFGGSTVIQYGTCSLTLRHRDTTETSTFYVVKSDGPLILGLSTCKALGLVTLNYGLSIDKVDIDEPSTCKSTRPVGDKNAKEQVLRDYGDVFKGIGCFEGDYHISVDPTVPPVVHAPRRVPVALCEPLKEELKSLVDAKILSKVDQPTDWVNSCVCVTKPNGKIRLCLDPKDLNKAIKRPHYYTPTLDDVLPKLSGAKYFSILDARSGYWNISLDEESSLLTTFNTPFGRYRYNRLPFGLNIAQDVYQKKVDETFGDIAGCTGISDDLVIAGWKDDGSDHDATLREVLERARATGTRFNEEKMVVRCKQIPFFGHLIGENGLTPDPAKVKAIDNMTEPEDIKGLQTFLGMVNYISRFSPKLATLTAPLRDLCKKDNDYRWGPEHSKAFADVKAEISLATSLKFYNSKKPLTLQVDSSLRGLGAAIIQDQGPVAYASKALTETETRYSNIEREMLGIVFGLERFHHYVFGRHVMVETDHKPLESIAQKNLNAAPPRLARMLLRIQRYNVDIKYVPGKSIPLADALSRINPCDGSTITGMDIAVHEMHSHFNASPLRIVQIREKTAKDVELAALREIISTGWPATRSECPTHLHGYWNYRDELGVEDGIIMKGTRIIIPQSLRNDVLDQLHYAHQGVEKCKLRAKYSVFWHGINADIERTVGMCAPCQSHQTSVTKEPLLPLDIPPRPWHTLATDLFYWEQTNYLLVADSFSKFPIVRKLCSTSSKSIIVQLKGIFDEHGIPEKLISDNGPQYSSTEFREFAKCWGFHHVTSSPLYPQANGFIERMVQTVKHLFTKARESGSDPHLAMLCLRTTPIDHHTPAPCELLNGRKYRSNVPTISAGKSGQIVENLQQRQDTQKAYYDRSTKMLPALHPQDHVRVRDPRTNTWTPGTVTDVADTPRSYNVRTANGSYRRNRRHIRKTREAFKPQVLAPPCITDEDMSTSVPTEPPDAPDVTSSSVPMTVPGTPLQPRRSGRQIKPPDRLDL